MGDTEQPTGQQQAADEEETVQADELPEPQEPVAPDEDGGGPIQPANRGHG